MNNSLTEAKRSETWLRQENCRLALTLQDHAVRSVLFLVSLSPWEVPADHKSGKKTSAQDHQSKYVIIRIIIPACPKHALIIYLTFLACKFSVAMHVQSKIWKRILRALHKPGAASGPKVYSSLWSSAAQILQHPWQFRLLHYKESKWLIKQRHKSKWTASESSIKLNSSNFNQQNIFPRQSRLIS